jgi:hypothetical protein
MATRAPAKKPVLPAGRAPSPRRLAIVPADPAALLRQHVDELGALEAELVEVRPKLRRVEVLHELIRKHYAKKPAQAAFEARGERFLATLGPCAYRSSIDYPAVQKHMGLKAYAEIARPTLKDLEEKLPPEVLARVVKYDYIGARPVKTFEVTPAK